MTFRPHWLSEGYEDLLAELDARASDPVDFDVVIVGSGYGGAVAAARLAGATATKSGDTLLRVCVLERGREYVPGAFPRRFADLPGHVRISRGDVPTPKGRRDGLYDFRIGNDVSALVGNGLGGGSLINASVAEHAQNDVFEDLAWPAALRRDLAPPAGAKGPTNTNLDDFYKPAEDMLEVCSAPSGHFSKFRAFAALGTRLGLPQAKHAMVARRFKESAGDSDVKSGEAGGVRAAGVSRKGSSTAGRNEQGVWQNPCIECGDCVTGCNVWAKNTLPMNYLARARRAGARLYTNVTVSRVARAEGAQVLWQVSVLPTAEQHPPALPRLVRAAHVILAAGTFGSTEILMRSRTLRFSSRLGERFSTNGDMISVLYGQSDPVNAAPEEMTPLSERHVGPTITGIIETCGRRSERVLIEELAIPGALRRVFEEVITTGALPAQLGQFDWSRHSNQAADPAAVDPEKVCRSQIFAAMGDDGSAGQLSLVEGWERADGDGAICVNWPDAGKADIFERQDKILSRAQGRGRPELYLRSPLWKPLPENLSALFSGPRPPGKLFTVHPLGGCPMGDDSTSGVVDDLGRVFDPPDTSDPRQRDDVARIHEGLLVLDGSIVPVALGVNPLLTIAALSERAVARYAALQNWTPDRRLTKDLPDDVPDVPGGIRDPSKVEARTPWKAPRPADTAVRFAETMTADLEAASPETARKLALDVVFSDITIAKFLRKAVHRVRIRNGTLRLLEDRGPAWKKDREVKASAKLKGVVWWMERGETCFLWRTLRGLLTWTRLRAIADLFERWRQEGSKGVLQALRKGGGALAICNHAGAARYLRYELKLQEDFGKGPGRLKKGTRIRGLKTFRYAGGGNPWRQLSALAITKPWGGIHGKKKLDVDFEAFFRRFAVQLQTTRQQDQPSAILDLASLALFMARIVFKSHFWSFRLPEYEKYRADRAERRLPQPLDGLGFARETVHVRESKKGPLALLLTHYRTKEREEKVKTPVVLFHGFGASGAQFAHPGLAHNLVLHLARDMGLDVWVAELRTSIALPSSYEQWTLDEVAKEDIPAIVQRVRELTRAAQVDVVAHCIGSAMFCTAALAGKLDQSVRRAVLLQVGPLITLSPGNRVRGRMAAALRRFMLADRVDSSVDDRADWLNAVVDRLLATYPYDENEARAHLLCPPWDPKTHIANCNRSAAVFGRLFEHANLDEKTLDLLGDLLGHTNLTTFEQTVHYTFLRRLTDYDATNAYVTYEKIEKFFNFPVRFVHGEENDVFDPETTRRSLKLLQDVFGRAHFKEATPADSPRDFDVRRKVVPGYGHLDPLIGCNAHEDVFPWISGFLGAESVATGSAKGRIQRYIRRPLIGPLLGWLRRDPGSGERKARIWCRTDDERSFGYFLIAVVLNSRGNALAAYRAPLGTKKQDALGELDRLGVIDVPLPASDDNCEIVVVSAHADCAANSSEPDQGSAPEAKSKAALLHEDEKSSSLGLMELPDLKDNPVDLVSFSKKLPDRYKDEVVALREGWKPRFEAGERARRVCDPGYDEGPDSVFISSQVLEANLSARGETCFALASCRFAASRVDREQADLMFGRLRGLLTAPKPDPAPPSLLVLVGDQIYADATAGMFDPKTRRERFYDSYREAWTAPNAREVLRRLPTYMMLDDHEVADNWHPGDRFQDKTTRKWGETAFREYQLAHSPRDKRKGDDPPYHYDFESGGFEFFVCDTRTRREGRSRIIDAQQFADLKEWLLRERKEADRPKFVVSPSVLAPFLSATRGERIYAPRSDGWDGFPDSLEELVSLIAENSVRNVVFLCGDSHISMASRIEFGSAGGAPVVGACIVASPLYAPYPFANADPREFLGSGGLVTRQGARLDYKLQPFADPAASAANAAPLTHVSGDSFTLVSARKPAGHWEVGVEVHVGKDAKRVATVKLG